MAGFLIEALWNPITAESGRDCGEKSTLSV